MLAIMNLLKNSQINRILYIESDLMAQMNWIWKEVIFQLLNIDLLS